jgi:hypothetical protein
VELACNHVDFPGWCVPDHPFGGTQLQVIKLYGVIGSFGPADLMQLSVQNPIEVAIMGENEPYVLSAVVPQRAHLGSESQFRADNQPEKRGRPRGSRNKMPRALKEMLVEVAEELGRVDYKDWDKLLCGEDDGHKGYLKFLAIREPKVFAMLICRALPPASRASVRRGPMREE